MHSLSRVRAALSSVLAMAAVLALCVVSTLPSAPVAHAAASSTSLIISEVNWAGSAANPADQWIELYNSTASAITFTTAQPYRLYNGSTLITTLDSGTVSAGGYFLVSRLAPAASVLTDTPGLAPDRVDPALILPITNFQLKLEVQSGATWNVVDQAGTGSMPPAGSATGTFASMARTTVTADGTLAGSWFTPHTIGQAFDAGTMQFGTPSDSFQVPTGALNPELANPLPTGVSGLPNPALPTVTGTEKATATEQVASWVTAQFTPVGGGMEIDSTPTLINPDGSFSVTPMQPLPVGLYRLTVTAAEGVSGGDHTSPITVPVTGSPQNVYTVNAPAVTVTPPTLNSYPTLVNTPTVTLTGTVQQPGTAVVISINGTNVAQTNLNGQTTFSLAVNLIPNTSNTIEVRARDAQGNTSAPVEATVVQDSMAPVITAGKVTITDNPAGQSDQLVGAAGAVSDTPGESGILVRLFADQALTMPLGVASVSADGSFGPISIGDNAHATVYLVAIDQAGNSSPVTPVTYSASLGGQQLNIGAAFTSVGTDRVTFTWNPVAGATTYHLKYKDGDGYSAEIDLCPNGIATCVLGRTIINLKPNTAYTIAIAAVDQFGQESLFTEHTFRTAALPVAAPATTTVSTEAQPASGAQAPAPTSSTPAPATGQSATSGATGESATPSPTPPPTPTPTATASPSPTPSESGAVQGAQTTNPGRNWVPWIILAVLIALAVLATLGYFYWFGGEEYPPAPPAAGKRNGEATPEDTTKPVAKESTPPKDKKGGDKEKRW